MEVHLISDYRIIILLGSFGMLVLVAAIIAFVYLHQRRMLKKNIEMQSIEDMLKKQELDAIYTVLDAQDIERKRIARELHDSVGSTLATLKMYADVLPAKSGEEQNEMASKISEISALAGSEARRLSHSLDDGVMNHFGFATAVTDLMETVNKVNKIEFSILGDFNAIPNTEIGIQLFRIIQELINNTLKHAKATKAELDFIGMKNSLTMIYSDNGVGFNPDENGGGMGLNNIKTRAEQLGATLEIESEIGKGCTFSFEIEKK